MIRRFQAGMLGATFALMVSTLSPNIANAAPECQTDADCLIDKDGRNDECLTGRCNLRTNTCVPVADETQCDDDNECTGAGGTDTCTDGVCNGANVAEDTACEDGNECTDSSCKSGACTFKQNVTGACGVGTGDCSDTGVCANGVCNGALAAGTECSDGNNCTDDVCDGKGKCISNLRVCGDADEDPCTIDECNPATGKCEQSNKDGSCSDGDLCNGDETCVDGKCATGEVVDCNDAQSCTTDVCDPDKGCINTDTCDTNPLDCVIRECDGNTCTQRAAESGEKCDDGNKCNGINTCNGSGQCVVKSPPNCNDANNCTDDTCTNTAPNPLPDEPGNYDDATGCLNTVKVCTDSTPTNCTDRVCDPTDGQCVDQSRASGALCGDANPCNGTQQCVNNNCVAKDPAPNCSDSNPCTIDTCDPTACGDKPCAASAGCTHPQKSCTDNQTCTLDSCNPDTGNCVFEPRDPGTKCTDRNQCTAEDTCVSGVCTSTKDTDCSDDNVCTSDTCDPNEGCINEVTDCCETTADCDDENACNGAETCVKEQGADVGDCSDGTPATCGGKPVTAGICTTGNDANIVGTEGNDVMAGLGGNDTMSGLGGNDTMCGNAGDDLIAGNQGDDVVAGGKGNDTVRGGQGGDTVMGQAGDDRILGQGGNDRLSGGPGTDRISGGSGTDTCSGGENVTGCP